MLSLNGLGFSVQPGSANLFDLDVSILTGLSPGPFHGHPSCYLEGSNMRSFVWNHDALQICKLGDSYHNAFTCYQNQVSILMISGLNYLKCFHLAVKFLDLGDGAGWELLQAMLNLDFRNRPIAEAVVNHRFLTGALLLVVQRPEIEPIIYRDLFLFRTLASVLNVISLKKLGCNAELIGSGKTEYTDADPLLL